MASRHLTQKRRDDDRGRGGRHHDDSESRQYHQEGGCRPQSWDGKRHEHANEIMSEDQKVSSNRRGDDHREQRVLVVQIARMRREEGGRLDHDAGDEEPQDLADQHMQEERGEGLVPKRRPEPASRAEERPVVTVIQVWPRRERE